MLMAFPFEFVGLRGGEKKKGTFFITLVDELFIYLDFKWLSYNNICL